MYVSRVSVRVGPKNRRLLYGDKNNIGLHVRRFTGRPTAQLEPAVRLSEPGDQPDRARAVVQPRERVRAQGGERDLRLSAQQGRVRARAVGR